ncbi:MAG: CpcT/CpeT family chromophore lyase [Steroidobacteraceae bacterium]|jgi:hypothetical protein|nr:CpcT/CpeT family chromophore lyase [Steroidobacteraceae bacterium]
MAETTRRSIAGRHLATRRVPAWRAAGALLLAACAAVLAGCTNDVKLREAELRQLAVLLPGRYDNRAQVQSDSAGAELALELNVAPIYAPFLSDHVFYVQENAWGDPRRVLSQRLFVFQLGAEKKIVQRVYGFAEPVRWRDGHLNTDLFKGLMGQDVGPLAGSCVLEWTLATQAFAARAPVAGPCAGLSRAELTPAGLTLGEPELRFQRRR